jgi:group I intron endonuclease
MNKVEAVSCGLYKIENLTNGKCYYGQTSVRLLKRKIAHFNLLESNTHHNKHLQAAYNKDGPEAFIFTIIAHSLKKEQLDDLECMLITIFNTTDPRFGYNKHPGGGSKDVLPETREKFRKNMLGKKMSEKTKQALRRANTGRAPTVETRKKISAGNKGKVRSLDSRIKGASKLREYCARRGVSPKAKPVIDSNGNIWPSMTHAGKSVGATAAGIHIAIKRNNRCGGLYFRFVSGGEQ